MNGKIMCNGVEIGVPPVGAYYTQYPAANANATAADYNTAFPLAERPQTMYGGVWELRFNGDGLFFRTIGKDEARTNGLQGYAMPNLNGTFSVRRWGHEGGPEVVNSSGVFGHTFQTSNPEASPYHKNNPYSPIINFASNRQVTAGNEVRPVNRQMLIWKRVA